MARAAYDPGGAVPFERIARQVYADGVILKPARRLRPERWSGRASRSGITAFPRTRWKTPLRPGRRRACQRDPFMFGTARGVLGEQVTAADQAMARTAPAYWAAFARTGDPNERYRPRWRRFDPESGGDDGVHARRRLVRAGSAARPARRRAGAPRGQGGGAGRPRARSRRGAAADMRLCSLELPTRPVRGRPSVIFLGAASLLLSDGPHAIVVNGFVTRPSEAEVREGRIAAGFFPGLRVARALSASTSSTPLWSPICISTIRWTR